MAGGELSFLPFAFGRSFSMKRHSVLMPRIRLLARGFGVAAVSLALAVPAFAQGNSPWENAVNVLQLAFTSTIARGLSLVAIVVSGLTFAFGEGGSKRVLAGVLFGVGMAIAAVNFLAWLFPA
jgi:type IV secretion system protein TrbC